MANGPLSRWSSLSEGRSRRISSYDQSGGNADHIKVASGETKVLAEIEGVGVITHLWFTISSGDLMHRRNLVLRMYWDGQDHPSVESPIGDFFGQGWGKNYNFVSLPLAAAPRDGKALVSYFPMPYSSGARITLENQGPYAVDALYYYIDYEEQSRETENEGRFHAQYRQELTAPESASGDLENEWGVLGDTPKNPSDRDNYVILEAEGKGHFVGVQYYVSSPGPIWYGEGDDMFLVDGEGWPGSLHGTGTEDYFNTSWSPEEHYLHPMFGIAYAPGMNNSDPRFGWIGKTHLYRFHLEDPIRFQKRLRASIEHGHANNLTLEIATVAYWYQTLPSRPFTPLASAEERMPRPDISSVDIHRWRDAWRRSKGGGALWGNEG
jgi:hypothetical protein